MYINGESSRDIAKYLNDRGYRTTCGNAFNSSSITPIIRYKRYIGRYTYDGVEYFDETQRIVDDETFERAQARIAVNTRCGSLYKAKERYLLSRKLYCGYCKCHMHGESGLSGDKKTKHYYYMCTGRKKQHICSSKNVKKTEIENYVLSAVERLFREPKVIERVADAVLAMQDQSLDKTEIRLLENRLADIERRIKNIMNAIEEGIITSGTQARLRELEEQQRRIQHEIDTKRLASCKFSHSRIADFFSCIELSADASFREKYMLIQNLVNRVYLWEDKIVIIFNFTPPQILSSDGENEIGRKIEDIIKTATTDCSVITVSGS